MMTSETVDFISEPVVETPVKQYDDPKRIFGPLTPAQARLYDIFTRAVPHGYPSIEALNRARDREVCVLGGKALNAVHHIQPMQPSEVSKAF